MTNLQKQYFYDSPRKLTQILPCLTLNFKLWENVGIVQGESESPGKCIIYCVWVLVLRGTLRLTSDALRPLISLFTRGIITNSTCSSVRLSGPLVLRATLNPSLP